MNENELTPETSYPERIESCYYTSNTPPSVDECSLPDSDSDESSTSEECDSSSNSSSSPNKDPTLSDFLNISRAKSVDEDIQQSEETSQIDNDPSENELAQSVIINSNEQQNDRSDPDAFETLEYNSNEDIISGNTAGICANAEISQDSCQESVPAIRSFLENNGKCSDNNGCVVNQNASTSQLIKTNETFENPVFNRTEYDVGTLTSLAKLVDRSFDATRNNPLRHMTDILNRQPVRTTAEGKPIYDNLHDLVHRFGKSEHMLTYQEIREMINEDFLRHWYISYNNVRRNDVQVRNNLQTQLKCKWTEECLSYCNMISRYFDTLKFIKETPTNTITEETETHLKCKEIVLSMQNSIFEVILNVCSAQEKLHEYNEHLYGMECEFVQLMGKKLVESDTSIQGQNLGEWYMNEIFDRQDSSNAKEASFSGKPSFDNLLDLCRHLAKTKDSEDSLTDADIRNMIDCKYAYYLHIDFARTKTCRNFNLEVYGSAVPPVIKTFFDKMYAASVLFRNGFPILQTDSDSEDVGSLNKDLKIFADAIYESLAELICVASNIHAKFSKFVSYSRGNQEAMQEFLRRRLRVELENRNAP